MNKAKSIGRVDHKLFKITDALYHPATPYDPEGYVLVIDAGFPNVRHLTLIPMDYINFHQRSNKRLKNARDK